MLNRLSDHELVRLVQNKDLDALKELYARYERLTYSLAMKLLGNSQEAEEVVQDVFIKLWNKSELFDTRGNSKFSSWLLTICKNAAIDKIKKRKGNYTLNIEELVDIPDIRVDLFNEVEFASIKKQIKGALRKLPDEQRELIELVYFEGLTQVEISEKTGIPLGTVKSRIRLGLHKLRKVLKSEVVHVDA